jgi:hypothetical protein
VPEINYLPEKVESRCHVCQSNLRRVIDQMGAAGFRPVFIANEVQDVAPELSRKSIERHLKNHVNYENKALQTILHERAKEEGIMTNMARNNILTRQAVLDQFVAQTWKRVSMPEAKIPYEVGLKAIELQEMMEQKAGDERGRDGDPSASCYHSSDKRSRPHRSSMKTLPDEQNTSSTPPPSVKFRQELRLILRELGEKLIDVDLTDPRNLGRVWQVRFGLWILDKTKKKS